MRCGQCLEADRARPAIDPSHVGGLAEAEEESVRVGQQAVIIILTRHQRGKSARTLVPRAAAAPAPPPWPGRCSIEKRGLP
jgi:hypothetical protein